MNPGPWSQVTDNAVIHPIANIGKVILGQASGGGAEDFAEAGLADDANNIL